MRYIISILIILCLFAAGCTGGCTGGSVDTQESAGEQLLSGDEDAHGCIVMGGYSWCEAKQKCLRVWEEDCPEEFTIVYDEDKTRAVQIAKDHVYSGEPDIMNLRVSDVRQARCPGCYQVDMQYYMDLGIRHVITIVLDDWQVVDSVSDIQDNEVLTPAQCLAEGGRTQNIVAGASCEEGEEYIGDVVGFISPNICCVPKMALDDAMLIAQDSPCANQGAFLENAIYNENTRTWWIDMDLEKEGCAPACVVDVETKVAQINWRCTGLLE